MIPGTDVSEFYCVPPEDEVFDGCWTGMWKGHEITECQCTSSNYCHLRDRTQTACGATALLPPILLLAMCMVILGH